MIALHLAPPAPPPPRAAARPAAARVALRSAMLAAAVLLGGCGGSPRLAQPTARPAPAPAAATPVPPPPPPAVAARTAPAPDAPPATAAPERGAAAAGEPWGPDILLPRADAADAEVARVGDVVLRQSHAFARLLSVRPRQALDAVDLLVFDVLVANHARQFGIRVTPERVEELAATEEQQLRRQVETELAGQMDFAGYVWREFGMREADWQALQRLRTAQRLYQSYVIRYLALREDRVQVRFLVHKDEKLAAEIADKTRAGADFATLASRHSEDPSRRDGGLLPPFGRGFQHPVATTAFTLKKGEVSAPFQGRWGEETRWFVVYCLDALAGRDLPFAELRAEIDAGLARNPISQLEATAYTLRWRGELDAKQAPAGADGR